LPQFLYSYMRAADAFHAAFIFLQFSLDCVLKCAQNLSPAIWLHVIPAANATWQ